MLRWWNWYTCTLEVRMPYGLRVRVPSSAVTNRQNIGESSNGRTPDFDSVCPGSNPGSPAKIKLIAIAE